MTQKKIFFHTAAAVICLCAILIRVNVASKHSFPRGDEGPWLRCALHLYDTHFISSNVIEHDLYGPLTFPHPEDNRSPLYPLLIRLMMVAVPDAFIAAQVVNVILFFALMLFIQIVVSKKTGHITALTSMLYIAVSPFLIKNVAHIYPDVTVAFGFFLLLWYMPSIDKSPLSALCNGAGLGLFFLLKSSAVILIPAYITVFFLKGDKPKWKMVLIFFSAFTVVSAPWILRNCYYFKSPFFQVTGHALTIDYAKDYWTIGYKPLSLFEYITRHGLLFAAIQRPFLGFISFLRYFFWFDHYLSLAVMPAGLIGLYNSRHTWKGRSFPFLIFSVFYLPLIVYFAYFGWVGRYTIIYYLCLYLLAGIGIKTIFDALSVHRVTQITVTAIVLILPLATIVYPLEYYISDRGGEHEKTMHAINIVNETKNSVCDSCSVVSSFLSQFAYMHNIRTVNKLWWKSEEDLYAYLAKYNVTHALLNTVSDKDLLNVFSKPEGEKSLLLISSHGPFGLYQLKNRRVDSVSAQDSQQLDTQSTYP